MGTTDQPVNDRVLSSPGPQVTASGEAAEAHEFVYDLRLDGESSQRFYADVEAFSRCVLKEVEARAGAALDGYSQYVTQYLRETPRSRGEYALEFLTVGMVLRLYGKVAGSTPRWVADLARELYAIRRRSRVMKSVADFLRAGLFQIFMRRDMKDSGEAGPAAQIEATALARLIEWLQATGEFEQEWRRLDNWRSYWAEHSLDQAAQWMAVSVALFDWFTAASAEALGKYTRGVIPFLKNTWAMRFWREDQIFCGRLPVEYHLGMVAAEVMNDGLREDFHSRPRKVLLVPGCLRGARLETCQAVTDGLDMTCAGCDAGCAIHKITKSMRLEGIEVYIVPHSSGFSGWLERWQSDPKVGVAAVACMMNILAGGYEMRARRIPSQCVPLDFPGCRKHWREEPAATSVNEERLVQIVARPGTLN